MKIPANNFQHNQARSLDRSKLEKQVDSVASGMETQFLEQMISEMRKSVAKDQPESTSENFYNSLLDQERAKIMATNQGIGIKDMIKNQLMPKVQQVRPHNGNIKGYMTNKANLQGVSHE